jgi:hypothetical protein
MALPLLPAGEDDLFGAMDRLYPAGWLSLPFSRPRRSLAGRLLALFFAVEACEGWMDGDAAGEAREY